MKIKRIDLKNLEKESLTAAKLFFPVLPLAMVSARGTEKPFDKDNIITVGRITGLTTTPPRLLISIKTESFSYAQIIQSREFAVNWVNRELLEISDWCGIVSGRDFDKYEETGLTPEKLPGLEYARGIKQSPLTLGCRLVHEVSEYESYGILIGEVVSATADKAACNENGRPLTSLLDVVGFDGIGSAYIYNGRKLGTYGYTSNKK
jgi:flavin reductase (DIM6/NTAB) family NADH-FMN oxidoreductase RutF